MLEILERNGFVNIEEIDNPLGTLPKSYKFLTYSEKIRPYIYKGDYRDYGKYFEIRLASRVLKSIDYKSKYKASQGGATTEYFAVIFSYTLKKDFPYLEELANIPVVTNYGGRTLSIDKFYKGKAKAYLDPDDGKWKLLPEWTGEGIVLEDANPHAFETESVEDSKKETAPSERKVSKASIPGRYVIQDEGSRLVPNVYFEFKSDGTLILNSGVRWEIEGNMIKIRGDEFLVGKEGEARAQIFDTTIILSSETWVKQEGAKQIRKTESGRLWSIYTLPELSGIDRWGSEGNIEFKKDGTVLFTFFGKWNTKDDEDNALRVYFRKDEPPLEGEIKGNTIALKGGGTLIKQTSWRKTVSFKTILLLIAGVLFLFTMVLVARKAIKTAFPKRMVVSRSIFCTQCGKENPASATFCTNCGEKL